MNVEQLGGKGYQLSMLSKICDVPPFFVIDGTETKEQILAKFDALNCELVSVRSSATVEDSNIASFAGMFETELNINRESLLSATEKIFQSVNSARVKEYCKLNNIDYTSIKMRVVIQKMVQSRVSGVCFTKDTNEDLIVEACWGLGESLVSGVITPDTFIVKRSTLELKNKIIGYQKTMITSKGTERVPAFLANAQKLSNDELMWLVNACLNIEKKIGYNSADIEWAYENEKLYILQARPYVAVN
ncbi:MAG: PEP/pyruvate-binding domain-containing protein [Christensenellaceae bacterium]|jgi:pyruvate,water dikinase|nr:PEP/pyruvate-binding domain-containing protein [Christensenellaceae bacterium]